MKLKKLLKKVSPYCKFTVGICDDDNRDRVYYCGKKACKNRKVRNFYIIGREIRVVLKRKK